MTDPIESLKRLAFMAEAHQRDREREKTIIGFVTNIPPLQLTDEQINEYHRQTWIDSMRAKAMIFPDKPNLSR